MVVGCADAAETIAKDYADYEDIAVDLGLNPTKLEALKRRLRENRVRCALFDTKRWVRNFERALHLAHDQHRSGRPTSDIEVPDVGPQDFAVMGANAPPVPVT